MQFQKGLQQVAFWGDFTNQPITLAIPEPPTGRSAILQVTSVGAENRKKAEPTKAARFYGAEIVVVKTSTGQQWLVFMICLSLKSAENCGYFPAAHAA